MEPLSELFIYSLTSLFSFFHSFTLSFIHSFIKCSLSSMMFPLCGKFSSQPLTFRSHPKHHPWQPSTVHAQPDQAGDPLIYSITPFQYLPLEKMAWLFLKSSLIIFPQVMASAMRNHIHLYFHVDPQHPAPY